MRAKKHRKPHPFNTMLTPWIIFRNRQMSHLAHVDALDGPIIHFCRIYLSFNSLRADICAQHSHCCLIIPSMYNVCSPTFVYNYFHCRLHIYLPCTMYTPQLDSLHILVYIFQLVAIHFVVKLWRSIGKILRAFLL